MIALTKILQDRISQLENRKMMIPRYVSMSGKFLGKKDFSLNDLPKIQTEIDEAKAALAAIEKLRAGIRQ